MTFPVIDAHQHVWDPALAEYDWLGPELAPIDRAMTFEDVAPELRAAGVDLTVQVQSADNPEDTALMRASAAAHREVAGIVGFAPLDDAEGTASTLEAWNSDPLMVGVRNLIHNKPDPDWLLRPEVREALAVLEESGLALDVVAVLPRHLELVPILSERHPRLRMVIDHLAKPPIGLESSEPWDSLIARAAENPLVYGKVSGLYSADGRHGVVDHRLDQTLLRACAGAVRSQAADVRRRLADRRSGRRIHPRLGGSAALVRRPRGRGSRVGPRQNGR